jgi:hypothetical protein
MSLGPKIRYGGVLNPIGRRLLNVCFEPLSEFFELHKEAAVETRIQVPEDPDTYTDPVDPSYEDDY